MPAAPNTRIDYIVFCSAIGIIKADNIADLIYGAHTPGGAFLYRVCSGSDLRFGEFPANPHHYPGAYPSHPPSPASLGHWASSQKRHSIKMNTISMNACDNNNQQTTQSIADYLAQLLKDRKQLAAFPTVFTHVERLLDEGTFSHSDMPLEFFSFFAECVSFFATI